MYDVAIIGGGPAGATCGALINQYDQNLKVVILEREKFPRDHVGESLLPAVSVLLDEMGCWDKMEAAEFPIKIGATYRWGATPDLWDFTFIPQEDFPDAQRPGRFEGLRTFTAFQVDRSKYDKILLDHAAERGCEVREETKIRTVEKDGDRVTGLVLDNGERIEARYYVDASGVSGILRRAMGVEVDNLTALKNIGIWDYWENAEWAVKIGVDGTRVLILSVDYGWLWFIPLGATRTSVGLIVPLNNYKSMGLKPDEIYRKALDDEPLIKKLLTNATCEENLQTTKDWSYVSDRLYGENWFLAGDSCGFADPILTAGLTLAQTGARQVAYTIMALEEGEHDAKWLKDSYDQTQRSRIFQHTRFADLWYGSNGCFADLREMSRELATKSGLTLDADDAFRWLASGGAFCDDPSSPILGGFALPAIKILNQRLSETESTWMVSQSNRFKMNLEGATEDKLPVLFNGQIWPKLCYKRGDQMLPMYGFYKIAFDIVEKHGTLQEMLEGMEVFFKKYPIVEDVQTGIDLTIAALEAMLTEGWATGEYDPEQKLVDFAPPEESSMIHANRDISKAILEAT